MRASIDADVASHYRRVTCELASPKRIGQQRDVIVTFLRIRSLNQPTHFRDDFNDSKKTLWRGKSQRLQQNAVDDRENR